MSMSHWPPWGEHLAWTVLTVLCGWGAGHVLAAMISARESRYLGRQQTLVASAIRAVRARLAAAGKPTMVIIGAAMRHLIHLAYGVLKSKQVYRATYGHP